MTSLFFIIILYLTAIVLIILIFNIYFRTKENKIVANKRFSDLEKLFKAETLKNNQIHQNIKLNDSLYQSLFNRSFQIIKKMLSFQKLFFEIKS